MDKYLIINADDFGMCHAHNQATFELFRCGGITSATVMAPCPWAFEAVKFARENPQFAVGVHLTTTSEWDSYRWGPVSGRDASSLTDEEGFLYHDGAGFESAAKQEEVLLEITAQIERLKAMGLEPSHLDNHMGTLYGIESGRFELLKETVRLAGRYGLPFRFPTRFTEAQYSNAMLGIGLSRSVLETLLESCGAFGRTHRVAMVDCLLPGSWDGPQKDSYENYREYIYELYRTFDNGVTETYIHPAVECDELKAITGSWRHRVWEYELFRDPRTRQHIEALGIRLISYRDLRKMRGF